MREESDGAMAVLGVEVVGKGPLAPFRCWKRFVLKPGWNRCKARGRQCMYSEAALDSRCTVSRSGPGMKILSYLDHYSFISACRSAGKERVMTHLAILTVAVWCVLSWLALPAWSAEIKPVPLPLLTLEQAVELAVQANRHMKVAGLEVEKAAEATNAARTGRLPSLNLLGSTGAMLSPLEFQFNQGALGTFPGIGPVPGENRIVTQPAQWSSFLFATAMQPLTPLLRINQGIRLSEVGEQIAKEQRRDKHLTVVSRVKREYFVALNLQSSLEATAEAIRFLQELDRVVTAQVGQRKAIPSDSLEVKARLAEAEYQNVTLENALASQKDTLNNLLGRDIHQGFRLTPVFATPTQSVEETALLDQALVSSPSVREARLSVQQAEHDKAMKALQYIPDVSLTVSHIQAFNIGQVLPNQISFAGAFLSWEVYDWGRKQRELATKRLALEQTRVRVAEAEARLEVEIRHQLRTVKVAQSLLPVKRLRQESSREKLRVVMTRYTQKSAVLQDVLKAQSALADADYQYQKALLDLLTAITDLERVIGEG